LSYAWNGAACKHCHYPEPGQLLNPAASTCPKCGSWEFKRVKAEGWVTFKDDRKCTACGTRYTPPIPIWAAVVFILLGILMIAFGIAMLVALGGMQVGVGIALGTLVWGIILPTVFGLSCIIYGIRGLIRALRRQDKPSNFTIGSFRKFPE
jgi:hypothetical protein